MPENESIPIIIREKGNTKIYHISPKDCDLAQFSKRHPNAPHRPDVEEVITAGLTGTGITKGLPIKEYSFNILNAEGEVVIENADLEDYVGQGEKVEIIFK